MFTSSLFRISRCFSHIHCFTPLTLNFIRHPYLLTISFPIGLAHHTIFFTFFFFKRIWFLKFWFYCCSSLFYHLNLQATILHLLFTQLSESRIWCCSNKIGRCSDSLSDTRFFFFFSLLFFLLASVNLVCHHLVCIGLTPFLSFSISLWYAFSAHFVTWDLKVFLYPENCSLFIISVTCFDVTCHGRNLLQFNIIRRICCVIDVRFTLHETADLACITIFDATSFA